MRNLSRFSFRFSVERSRVGTNASRQRTLSGTVTDPNKAPVPGAQVTLSNSETGFRRQFTTGETGQYTFALIPPVITS